MSRGVSLFVVLALAGCDHFEQAPPSKGASPEQTKAEAHAAMKEVVSAAERVTASCAAGELLWEADENVGYTSGGEGFAFRAAAPTHFSRPCIPERCAPKAEDVAALEAKTRAARAIVDARAALRVPSYLGFLATADAMVGFAEAAAARGGPSPENRFSGLSMHHSMLVTAYRDIVPDNTFPPLPASLSASLAAPEPGGDVCKGWRVQRFCDVRAVRVPKVLKWRAEPPCIEVESVKK